MNQKLFRVLKTRIVPIFLAAVMVLLSGTAVMAKTGSSSAAKSDTLEVHFIDVGQGDSTLIKFGDKAMLIDAGTDDQGTKIQNYLKKQNVKTLNYVIGTHPDADHIGGLDVILTKFDCEKIIMPDETKDTNAYRDVAEAMKYKNYKTIFPVVGKTYFMGNAKFTILAPAKKHAESNDNSVAILLKYCDSSFLFTGDAEAEGEADILNSGVSIDADVYKVGHHGSSTASSGKLLKAVSPEYAVISCGEDNSYGHPHAEVLNNLRAMKTEVFRTDEQGSIIAASDGKKITWNCAPSDTWKAGEPTGSAAKSSQTKKAASTAAASTTAVTPAPVVTPPPAAEPAACSYIGNKNTHKFHIPSCSSVNDMNEENKYYSNETKDEMIAHGYVPCKRCNP